MNIAKNKNLELPKSKHFMLQVGHEGSGGRKCKKISHQSQQNHSLLTDSWKQREKRKTCTEALKRKILEMVWKKLKKG